MAGRYFRNRKYRKKKFRVRILAIKDAKHCQNPLQFMFFVNCNVLLDDR